MRGAWLLTIALAAGCAQAGPAVEGALEIESSAVEIAPGELTGLDLLGTQSLTARHPEFGGLSGLAVRNGHLYAVTDQGWWLDAALSETPGALAAGLATFSRLLAADGASLGKTGGDAEGLAFLDGVPVISFERDHRLMVPGEGGRLGGEIRDRAFEALGTNSGLEGLAALPDGRLLAIAEGTAEGGHPMFLIGPDGAISAHALPEVAPFSVTGADLGPDGRLYVVLRHFTRATGVSIQIHRYGLDADGLPDPVSREVLADYRSVSGIDNMEGLALWQDADGRTRLALISDDNFNAVQRTLLMDFLVLD